ncbi:MAG TPA: dTDP-4-dehydrorhamnose 3,5-epimerase family protein [Solirubrobacteraceae bacterium]|nr:dTDP-4-dehydrorhamnose 3,5-epimerase family protein [Solirubrobacteraceae bacterium]
MRVRETGLAGVWIVDVDPSSDERGLFARTFDAEEFRERGLSTDMVQCSTSFNTREGTLRGMHHQAGEHAECKLVRCTAGAVYDVLVDLRDDSPTHAGWEAVELSAADRRAVYVPRGVAHGFQTLVAGSELLYMIDRPFVPAAARGVRWDDPAFGIEWPEPGGERTMSERDRSFPDYVDPDVALAHRTRRR